MCLSAVIAWISLIDFLSSVPVLKLEVQEGVSKGGDRQLLVYKGLRKGEFLLGVLASLTTKKYSELAAGIQKGEKRRKKNCETLGQLPANLQLFVENTLQFVILRRNKI